MGDANAEIAKMKADLKKAEAKAKKADAEQKRRESASDTGVMQAAIAFVASHDINFVAALDRYVVKVGGKPKFIRASALSRTHSEFSHPKFINAFTMAMEDAGRNFLDCTYGFNIPAGILNLLDTSTWVKPIPGDSHWIFDVLMESLGCGKPDNITHLERVTWYHYEHPECFTLPCIVIGGEGGTGRNLFMDNVLNRMYAGNTVSTTAENIIGQFNSLMLGVMGAMINESQASKLSTTALKDRLHKATLYVNQKSVPQFEAQNLALYFISCNFDRLGAVMLDRSNADRRLSVLFCERDRTLLYWLSKRLEWSHAKAKAWLKTEGLRICSDRTEIGKWLYKLQQKYQGLPEPDALHAEDFVGLMNKQKAIYERLFAAVFNDPNFTHIQCEVLWESYIAVNRNERFAIGRNVFYDQVEEWLYNQKKTILRKPIHYGSHSTTPKATWLNGNCLSGPRNGPDGLIDNRPAYVAGQGSNSIYQGPELDWWH